MSKFKLSKKDSFQFNRVHKIFINLCFSILLLNIFTNSQAIVLPAQSVQSTYVRAGSYSWSNPNTNTIGSITVNTTINYVTAITNGSPLRKVALSFESLSYVSSATYPNLDYKVISQNVTNTGFVSTLTCQLYRQNIASAVVRYLTVDTTIPYSKIHIDYIFQNLSSPLRGVNNITFVTAYDTYTPLQNLTFLAGHSYAIQYYHNCFYGYGTTQKWFALSLTQVVNTTHYTLTNLIPNNKLYIKQLGFYTVIIDKSASFLEYDVLEVTQGIFNALNNNSYVFVAQVYNKIVEPSFFFGVSSFDMTGWPNLDYLTTIRQSGLNDIKILQGRKYTYVYYYYLGFEKITCTNSAAPILRMTVNSTNSSRYVYDCVSDCGPRMGGPLPLLTTNMTTCGACTILSCYTCATNLIDCLTCNSTTDHRVLNGTICSPLPGYYQNGTVIAPICPSLCATCTNSTNCTTCISGAVIYSPVTNQFLCQCTIDSYYQSSNNTCTLCISTSLYCIQCVNKTACTKCQNDTYFLQVNNCKVCAAFIIGCYRCNSSSFCLECQAGFVYNSVAGTCSCPVGQFLNTTSKTCVNCTTGCSACVSLTNCTNCTAGYYKSGITCLACPDVNCISCTNVNTCINCVSPMVVSTVNTSACTFVCTVLHCVMCPVDPSICTICDTGYIVSPTNSSLCTPSSCSVINCITCPINPNICTQCTTGYQVNATNSSLCEAIPITCSVINCISCPTSSNICAQCTTGYQVNATNSSLCEAIPITCSVINCISCPTSSNICAQCTTGYQVNATNSSLCEAIPITCSVINCISCPTSPNICTQCTTGYQVNAANSSLCQAIPSSCGVINCLTCIAGTSNCSTCIMGYYVNPNNQCLTRCGDGVCILSAQQCDDGNLDSMDGCSPQCLIQTGFVCSLPPAPKVPLSDCTYTEQIDFKVVRLQKVQGENQVMATATISPLLKAFQNYDFASLVSTDLPVSQMLFSYDAATGVLKMTMNYTSTIQDVEALVTINPPNIGVFRLTPSTSLKITMNTVNNAGLYVYDDKDYQIGSTVSTFAMLLAIVAWILFLLGLFAGKMIVVQMFAVFQISYFSLMTLSNMSPSVLALRNLFISNGFNPFLVTDFYEYDYFPSSFKGIHLMPQFFNDLNITFVFIMIPLIVSLISLILMKTKFKEVEQKRQVCQKVFLASIGQFTFLMIMISLYLISVSSIIEFFYGFKDLKTGIDYISIPQCIILLALVITYFVVLIVKPEIFGEFKNSFDTNNRLSYALYNYMMVQRLFISIILVAIHFSSLCLIIPLALFVLEIIYFIVKKPYEVFKHNYRMVANNVIAIVIMIIYIYIGMDSVGSATSDFGLYLPYIILGLLAGVLVLNGFFIVVGFIVWVRQKCLAQNGEEVDDKQSPKKLEEFQMSYFKAQNSQNQKQCNQFQTTLVSQMRKPDESMIIAPQVENIAHKNSDDSLRDDNRMEITVPTFVNIDQFFSERPQQFGQNVLESNNREISMINQRPNQHQQSQSYQLQQQSVQQQKQEQKQEQDEKNNVKNILSDLKKMKKQNSSSEQFKSNKKLEQNQNLNESIGQMLNDQHSNRVSLLDQSNYDQI